MLSVLDCDVSRSEQDRTRPEPCKNYFELSLSNNLKHVRERLGMTQDQLGGFFSVGKSTVSTWESSSRLPESKLPKLLEILKCTREDLVGGSEQKQPEFRTSSALRIMQRAQLLDTLKQSVDGLVGGADDERRHLIDGGIEILFELKRREDEL